MIILNDKGHICKVGYIEHMGVRWGSRGFAPHRRIGVHNILGTPGAIHFRPGYEWGDFLENFDFECRLYNIKRFIKNILRFKLWK